MRWVVGDVHGMLVPLRAIVDTVRARDQEARFFFAGDYVNRGPDSRGVIDLLLALKDEGVARFVRGNHDDVFDVILSGQTYGSHPDALNPVSAFQWFINYGLENTLTSYGVDLMDIEWARHHPAETVVRRLFEAVPESHRHFIRSLSPLIDEPDLFVVHAMWKPDDPDESMIERLAGDPRLRRQVLWGRYTNEVHRAKAWRRTGYFGHTPVDTFPPSIRVGDTVPIRGDRIVLLDTGAALSPAGRLTAVCAETGEVLQVARSGEVVV